MMGGCLFVALIVLMCFGFLTIFFHSKVSSNCITHLWLNWASVSVYFVHAKVRFKLTKKINHFNHRNFYKYLNKLHSNFNLYESTLMTFIYLYLFFYLLKIIRLVYACLGALIFGLVWTTF